MSPQQSLQTATWAISGQLGTAARHHMVHDPSPANLRQNVQPRAKKPGGGQNESRRRRPASLPTSRTLGGHTGHCAAPVPQETTLALKPTETMPGGSRPRTPGKVCLSGDAAQVSRSPARSGVAPMCPAPSPNLGSPPATSPLTAAFSSAAIAGATRPAPQPQVWQHRKVQARPEPAQVATPPLQTLGLQPARFAARQPRIQSMRTGASPPGGRGAAGLRR